MELRVEKSRALKLLWHRVRLRNLLISLEAGPEAQLTLVVPTVL